MPETRLWQCPGCSKTYRIPVDRADPAICPTCKDEEENAIVVVSPPPLWEERPQREQSRQPIINTLAVVLVAVTGIVIFQSLFDDGDDPVKPNNGLAQPQKPVAVPRDAIPSDVSFSVINSTTVPGIKRSLTVRLNKKVSKKTLAAIAHKLKVQDPGAYDRTFITYYLPGMAVGSGAWATTHFNPDIDVRILGLTAQSEKKNIALPAPTAAEVVGRWLDSTLFRGSRIVIFRKGGRLFVEQTFKDGGRLETQVIEKKSPLGRRFDKVEGSISRRPLGSNPQR